MSDLSTDRSIRASSSRRGSSAPRGWAAGARALPRVRHAQRGQSLVEFTLVVPILLLILIGVADLGRVFIAGVDLETAARDAAERGGLEYVSNPPGSLSTAPPGGNGAYYGALDAKVASTACSEAAELPNTDIDTATQRCATWPVVRVCVHDGVDPQCGQPITGFAAAIPPECSDMNAAWDPSQHGSAERWVEVRVCYRYTAILHTAFLRLGDIYIERRRQFVIPCYFALGSASACG